MKNRLIIEIETARNGYSIIDKMRDNELSKGDTDYYKKKIQETKLHMTQKRGIPDNWVSNGCIDISDKDGYWLEEVIKVNLNDRPEAEVWQEVQWFLRLYFRLKEYEKYIIKDKKGEPTAWAYAYCILDQIGAYKINKAPEGKLKAIQALAEKNHFDAKTFETAFNRLRKAKQKEKTRPRQIPTIKKAIEILSDNREAKLMAERYLRLAETAQE